MSELLKTPKDKRQFKTWLKALRSGEYNQAIGRLQTEQGFCCLGVGCKVVMPEEALEMFGNTIWGGCPISQPSAPLWLRKVNRDFCLRAFYYLHDLNDRGVENLDRFTFDEIADLLEAVYVLKVLE